MNTEYLGIAITFVLAAVIAGGMILLTTLLGPKNPTPAKNEPFECGESPFELPKGRASIQLYLVGMLFILFDVELIFLFPWAVVFKELGWFGLIEMLVFLGIVLIGFVYAWKKGALEWE